MDTERQQWLVRLLDATSAALAAVEEAADHRSDLHCSLLELRDRLRAELATLEVDA